MERRARLYCGLLPFLEGLQVTQIGELSKCNEDLLLHRDQEDQKEMRSGMITEMRVIRDKVHNLLKAGSSSAESAPFR
jgi:hypothetical protein